MMLRVFCDIERCKGMPINKAQVNALVNGFEKAAIS